MLYRTMQQTVLLNRFCFMTQYFNSGFITFRKRKIGIVFSGETAEHIMNNYMQMPQTHPLKHIRIQQVAKRVKEWEKESNKRYSGTIIDNTTQTKFRIIAEIYTKFALIITAYKI